MIKRYSFKKWVYGVFYTSFVVELLVVWGALIYYAATGNSATWIGRAISIPFMPLCAALVAMIGIGVREGKF